MPRLLFGGVRPYWRGLGRAGAVHCLPQSASSLSAGGCGGCAVLSLLDYNDREVGALSLPFLPVGASSLKAGGLMG